MQLVSESTRIRRTRAITYRSGSRCAIDAKELPLDCRFVDKLVRPSVLKTARAVSPNTICSQWVVTHSRPLPVSLPRAYSKNFLEDGSADDSERKAFVFRIPHETPEGLGREPARIMINLNSF